ncbi:MAG: ABC transporter ATP-binding protein [Oscillospiraceae bacterium]
MKKSNSTLRNTIANNFFLIKICMKECPWHIAYFSMMCLISQIIMFLEWVFGIKYVLDSVEFNKPLSRPIIFLCIMLVVHTMNALLGGFCWHNIWQKAQPKMQKAMKNIMYEKARTLDLECYDDPEYYNKYILSINEANNMVNRAMQLLQRILESLTIIILYGGFYLVEDKISFLFVIASFALTFLFSKKLNTINFNLKMECNPVERKRSYLHRVHYLAEYAKELRLYPEYNKVLFSGFQKSCDELEQINKKHSGKKFAFSFLKSYISNDFILQVMFLIYLVFRASVMHAISYSDVVVLFNSARSLRNSLRRIADLFPYAQETSLYVDKANEFLSYEPKIVGGSNDVEPENHSIELENVSFSYQQSEKVIDGINLEIKPFDKIAIVGYNGAGKTTLVKLLMRLYDVSNGKIELDNNNIKSYKLEEYRKLFGTCFQDFKIFACSLKENVVLDTDGISDSEVKDVLKDSGFADRLEKLENGLETQLTTEFDDNGVNLSGGEAQKVAISRAFHQKSPIIILDEPSAALDPISEYELNNFILDAGKDKTILFISHRLSTTRKADKIIMLENGKIIEMGSHAQLLAVNGKYAEMWEVQSGQYR